MTVAPSVRLAVFDCDGTLVDGQHMITAAMRAAFQAEGLPEPAAEAVLARGYALVLDEEGRLLTRAREITPGAALILRFSDGTVGAKAEAPRGRQGLLSL